MTSTSAELNPPKTSDFYETDKNLPQRFDEPSWFKGYGSKPQHPMYRTSNNDYGSKIPTVHEMPTKFFPMDQEFSQLLGKTGMYRNCGLNTAMDQKRV